MSLESPVEDYYDKLVDDLGLKLTCVFQVKETNQVFSDIDERRLVKPGLTIEVCAKSVYSELLEKILT